MQTIIRSYIYVGPLEFVDANAEPPVKMYDSDAIVSYLWRTYGAAAARKPLTYRVGAELLPGPLHLASLFLSRARSTLPPSSSMTVMEASDDGLELHTSSSVAIFITNFI